MASSTAELKVELAARFDGLTRAGAAVDAAIIVRVAAAVLREDVQLDERQVAAAGDRKSVV